MLKLLDSSSFKKLDKNWSAHLVVPIEALWAKTFDALPKPYQDCPVDANWGRTCKKLWRPGQFTWESDTKYIVRMSQENSRFPSRTSHHLAGIRRVVATPQDSVLQKPLRWWRWCIMLQRPRLRLGHYQWVERRAGVSRTCLYIDWQVHWTTLSSEKDRKRGEVNRTQSVVQKPKRVLDMPKRLDFRMPGAEDFKWRF
jgi:hypothetical protein